jgi:hypothetical protein
MPKALPWRVNEPFNAWRLKDSAGQALLWQPTHQSCVPPTGPVAYGRAYPRNLPTWPGRPGVQAHPPHLVTHGCAANNVENFHSVDKVCPCPTPSSSIHTLYAAVRRHKVCSRKHHFFPSRTVHASSRPMPPTPAYTTPNTPLHTHPFRHTSLGTRCCARVRCAMCADYWWQASVLCATQCVLCQWQCAVCYTVCAGSMAVCCVNACVNGSVQCQWQCVVSMAVCCVNGCVNGSALCCQHCCRHAVY